MAIIQDSTRHDDLKARLVALNCELHEDQTERADRFYVLDKNIGKLVSVGATIQDTYDWCAREESAGTASWRSRGKPRTAAPDDRPLSATVIARLRDRLNVMHRRKD